MLIISSWLLPDLGNLSSCHWPSLADFCPQQLPVGVNECWSERRHAEELFLLFQSSLRPITTPPSTPHFTPLPLGEDTEHSMWFTHIIKNPHTCLFQSSYTQCRHTHTHTRSFCHCATTALPVCDFSLKTTVLPPSFRLLARVLALTKLSTGQASYTGAAMRSYVCIIHAKIALMYVCVLRVRPERVCV